MSEKTMILLALEMLAYMQLCAGCDPETKELFESNYLIWIRDGRQAFDFSNLMQNAQSWGYQMPMLKI